MGQAQQVISEKVFKLIRMAEHPHGNSHEANVAAAKAFEHFRKEGVSLSDILTRKAAPQVVFNPLSSILMMEKQQLTAEVGDLRTKLAGMQEKFARSQEKVSSLSEKVVVAKNEARELRDASKTIKAKVSDAVASALKASKAEMAEMKAELKSARAQAAGDRAKLAAERAKAAPIPVATGAAPAPNAPVSASAAPASICKRSQGALKAWVTRRAKASACAQTATSAPAAPATISKRSQGAVKAWATRRAKAAGGARMAAHAAPNTQARKVPRESITTRVVEILKSCAGMSLDAQALGERLATNWAYQNKGYNWHSRLSGQLRTEVLSQMESMRKFGVTIISVPFGTRMTHRFVWTGRGGEGKHIQPTYSFRMSATKFKEVRETVSDLIDPATWSVTGGRRKGVKSVRVWVEDESAATMFKLAS